MLPTTGCAQGAISPAPVVVLPPVTGTFLTCPVTDR